MTNQEYIADLIMSGRAEEAEQEMRKAAHDFLSAEHKQPERKKQESTVVMTLEVTEIIKGEPPMPQVLRKAAEISAKKIKSMFDADDVTAAEIQCFVRDAE